MKRTLLTITLLLITTSVYSQTITIGQDGIVRCKGVPVGTTKMISRNVYEVVDRDLLIKHINELKDLTKVCVSNITDMSELFSYSEFNQPIGNWDVSSVTDMSGMFMGSNFNQPIGDWDVSNVTDMSWMFTESQFNQPIGNWDVSKVTNMADMFSGSQFNQSINLWCVLNIKSEHVFFSTSSPLTPQNKPIWGTCPRK